MDLIVYINSSYGDWYVGELYKMFIDYLKNIKGVTVEVVSSKEKAKELSISDNFNHNFPSILNPYNILIQNKKNGKTFVQSFHDHAPAIMEKLSGIEKFDVVKFAFCSNLTNEIYEKFGNQYKIQPSIYLLELMSEHTLISLNKTKDKRISKVYFNGACYGYRQNYVNIFQDSNLFYFKNKHTDNNYRTKQNYYEEYSQYKYSFNLDGAAKICYRDLESFGLGSLLFREKLDILTYEPIIDGKHYINIIDEDVNSKLQNSENNNYIKNKLESKVLDFIGNNENVEYITNEAREWFYRNCLPENQVKILFSFLEDFEIFK